MPRSVLDDLTKAQLDALLADAYARGAWAMLVYLIAFYEAQRGR